MTRLEKERADEYKWKVKGQTALHVIEIGRMPHNKSYFCIRETRNGYYVQSFNTVVLYVSKKDGRLVNTWGSWTRATTVHINKALEWIRQNTQTVPERRYLSSDRYMKLPIHGEAGNLYQIA